MLFRAAGRCFSSVLEEVPTSRPRAFLPPPLPFVSCSDFEHLFAGLFDAVPQISDALRFHTSRFCLNHFYTDLHSRSLILFSDIRFSPLTVETPGSS